MKVKLTYLLLVFLLGIPKNSLGFSNEEIQRVVGEDDLVSTGTACRILGVCSKVLKVLADQRKFSVYHHMKERRYNRGELLDYRNKYRLNKKVKSLQNEKKIAFRYLSTFFPSLLGL